MEIVRFLNSAHHWRKSVVKNKSTLLREFSQQTVNFPALLRTTAICRTTVTILQNYSSYLIFYLVEYIYNLIIHVQDSLITYALHSLYPYIGFHLDHTVITTLTVTYELEVLAGCWQYIVVIVLWIDIIDVLRIRPHSGSFPRFSTIIFYLWQ